MKHLLLIIIFFSTKSFSQSFSLSPTGYEPQILKMDSMSAKQLYDKTIKWVNASYRKPSEVLVEDAPGERIRLNAFMKDAYFIKQLGQKLYYDIYYTFLIEFKEGKMRVSFTPEQIMADGRKALFTYKTFFKEDGSVRPAYKDAPPSLNENVNGLVRSLLDSFIEKKSDW